MFYGITWEQWLLLASGFSLLMIIISMIGVPWLVARLPADYFCHGHRERWRPIGRTSASAMLLTLLKNAVGLVLVVLGLIMLVTPGQGLLTLFAGMLLMNFPGKYHLEQALVRRPAILAALNWLRRRGGHAPFQVPEP